MTTAAAVEQSQQQHEQQQQQEDPRLEQHVLHHSDRQHSWLDDLLQADGLRRVEAISVFAGFHARSSSSTGGPGDQSDPLLLHTPALLAGHADHGPGADAAEVAAVALVSGGDHTPQGGGDHRAQQQLLMQQQQQAAPADAVQLLEWQLSELQQLLDAGMLPVYAVTELSGLQLEELDEILVGCCLQGAGWGAALRCR